MIGRLKREAAPGRTETRDMAARAKLRDIFRRTISKSLSRKFLSLRNLL
jgi:hypothetical protein